METEKTQPTVSEYVQALKESPRFRPQVVHHQEIPGSKARFADLERPLPDVLERALSGMEIERLYSHQAEAIDAIRNGRHVIVSTPTASGKSLIYNVPVLERIIAGPETRALYLFPLKALAQDQLRAVEEMNALLPAELRVTAAIYDGDTSAYKRKKLREHPPHILISNPEMLHLSLLAYHESWAAYWRHVRYVILDEVHTYRGVFGSHMAWVLRRLRRICSLYGAEPQCIMSSATIGNPEQLAADLLGTPVQSIIETGAPTGGRHFVFIDPHESTGYVASQLLEAAVKRGLRTIVYTQSRKMTELVALWTQDRLGPLKEKLTAYRAGFLPEERREIEARLSSGALLGVVSTSALELGIDIGSLDVCILVGYPGTIMATWQRSGRVGRRQADSLVVLIAQEDALDKHFMRNPDDFFSRGVEAAVLNPENRVIVKKHLLCAAAEKPLDIDGPFLAGGAAKVAREMAEEGELLYAADGKTLHTGRKYPQREVDLRGSGRSFIIYVAADNQMLGEIDGVRAFKECYPGAVYLHRGKTWMVTELDVPGGRVTVVRRNVNFFTRPLGHKHTEILETYESKKFAGFTASFGYLRVTETVSGFQRRLVSGQKLIATETLDLPPFVFETEGLWIEIPKKLQDRLERGRVHFMGGIHAVEHAAIGIFPLQVLCDRNDVGGIAQPFHPQLGGAAIFIYDGYPGGVGLSRQAFEKIGSLLNAAAQSIDTCSCEVGCPSCVHSPKCGSGNRPIDKEAASLILEGILGEHTDSLENGEQQMVRSKPPVAASAPSARASAAPPDRFGVFDVETKLSAEEVGGWHRAERMGVSIAVLYDSRIDDFLVFREHEIPAMVACMQKMELVVGFNNKRFDNKVLSAYTPYDLYALPAMDIMEEIVNRLGYRLSLDHLAEHTLGAKKTANGLMALKWYKAGEFDKIIEYCRKDVEITRNLYLFGLENGYLLFRNKAGTIVRCPVSFGR